MILTKEILQQICLTKQPYTVSNSITMEEMDSWCKETLGRDFQSFDPNMVTDSSTFRTYLRLMGSEKEALVFKMRWQ